MSRRSLNLQIPVAFPLRHADQIQGVFEVVHVQEDSDLVQTGEWRARFAERHVGFQFGRVHAVFYEIH